MRREVANPEHLDFPSMSQVVRTGPFAAVSGQVAFDHTGTLVGEGDPATQAEQCFANLASVLDGVGLGLDDVVKLTCYLTDISVFEHVAAVKAQRWPTDPPASTAVVVSSLLDPRMLVEVEALAVATDGTGS